VRGGILALLAFQVGYVVTGIGNIHNATIFKISIGRAAQKYKLFQPGDEITCGTSEDT
jgi:hypothetical protein